MKYEIKQTDNVDEALCMLFGGLMYFLKHHTKKTLITIMLVCGSIICVLFDYLSSDTIKVEKLKPLTEEMSLFPNLFAQGKNTIMLDGKYYGEYDPNFIVYKLKNSNELIIYNKQLKSGYRFEIPALEKLK